MNGLFDKSSLNIDASELLYNAHLYDSVCHPAYYACLQRMKHKLIKKGISLENQASETSNSFHGHSHLYLINRTCNYIVFKNPIERRSYENSIKTLKIIRESSDYELTRITPEKSEECIRLAKEVIRTIDRI